MKEKMIPIVEIEEKNDVAKRERCAAYVKGMRSICQNNRMEKENREEADRIGGVVK